jgi:hypothetical protein
MSAVYPIKFPDLFFTAKNPHQGKHINKLLAIMAAILPISVEFQIHQVVLAFQMSMAKKLCQKKADFLSKLLATKSKGINPKKMRKVKGDIGQAAKSNNPDSRLALMDIVFFKTFFLRVGSSE